MSALAGFFYLGLAFFPSLHLYLAIREDARDCEVPDNRSFNNGDSPSTIPEQIKSALPDFLSGKVLVYSAMRQSIVVVV